MTTTEADKSGDDFLVLIEATRAEHVPRTVVDAQGCWVTMADGRRMLDMHGQYMCVGVGHGNERIRAALHEAVDGLDFVCELLSFDGRAKAAELLVTETMRGSDRFGGGRFVSSGSEAVEMAILIARLYTNRPAIVVSQASYHGWTTGAAAATTLPLPSKRVHGHANRRGPDHPHLSSRVPRRPGTPAPQQRSGDPSLCGGDRAHDPGGRGAERRGVHARDLQGRRRVPRP